MASPLPSGTQLGRYKILSQLGVGGMGEVYLAQDTKLNRKVAIKLLLAGSLESETANRRLLREAQSAANLDHPNICAIHEVSEEGGRNFICMQYVEGETLEARMKRRPLEFVENAGHATQLPTPWRKRSRADPQPTHLMAVAINYRPLRDS